jgi:hypothetical protein
LADCPNCRALFLAFKRLKTANDANLSTIVETSTRALETARGNLMNGRGALGN